MSLDKCCALILAHNSGGDVAECVANLLEIFDAKDIIVGDNASTDGCAENLPNEVEVVRFQENIGYCAGTNRLMEIAAKKGAEYILSLNPDARIDKENYVKLTDALKSEGEFIAYPRVLRAGDSGILDGAWSEITWRHLALRMVGEGEKDGPAWRVRRNVVSGHGCCFFARLRNMDDLRGFDEEFFAYQEEADLGLRAAKKGLKIVYEGRAEVKHRGPLDDDAKKELKAYYLARNSVLLVQKHGRAFVKIKFAAFCAIAFAFYSIKAFAGDSASRNSLAGWRDGLAGHRGKKKSGSEKD